MVPRHKIDISAADLLFALLACLTARSTEREARDALRALAVDETEGLLCLSVRSGLELLLEALKLPAGSEILVSAVTHPDIERILERHEIVAVPVDLEAVEREWAVTPEDVACRRTTLAVRGLLDDRVRARLAALTDKATAPV
jgi:hypothetical protein